MVTRRMRSAIFRAGLFALLPGCATTTSDMPGGEYVYPVQQPVKRSSPSWPSPLASHTAPSVLVDRSPTFLPSGTARPVAAAPQPMASAVQPASATTQPPDTLPAPTLPTAPTPPATLPPP